MRIGKVGRSAVYGRGIRMTAAAVIVSLWLAVMPGDVQAKFVDRSDELPGMGDTDTGTIVTLGALGAAAVVGLILYKKHKGAKNLKLDIEEPRFGNLAVGQRERKELTISNLMGITVNVREIGFEDESAGFSVVGEPAFPLAIAPGSSLSVPVEFSPRSDKRAKTKIRVVSAVPGESRETTQEVEVRSGH